MIDPTEDDDDDYCNEKSSSCFTMASTTDGAYYCYKCDPPVNFRFEENLEAHENVHKTKLTAYRCILSKSCEGLSFVTLYEFRAHQLVHTAPPFRCDVSGCHRGFHAAYLLKSHKKFHRNYKNNPKEFKCPVCSKYFYSERSLSTHNVLIH